MSMEMLLGFPACCAMATAPMTPAAGPDKIVCTGRSMAVSAPIVPPLDCMMYRSDLRPTSAMLASSRRRYRSITGAT